MIRSMKNVDMTTRITMDLTYLTLTNHYYETQCIAYENPYDINANILNIKTSNKIVLSYFIP